MTRKDIMRKISSLGSKADKLWDDYKVWAFQTAFGIRRKATPTGLFSAYDALTYAIAWTVDSGTTWASRNDRELEGFVRWHDEICVPSRRKISVALKLRK